MKISSLFEAEYITSEKDLVKLIKRDCQPYIKTIGDLDKYQMLRGLWVSSRMDMLKGESVISAKVRKDRKPIDTRTEASALADDWFEDNFGSRFRSEALFCVGDKNMARKYGKAYVIFPKGNFTYCWSESYDDFYNNNAKVLDDNNIDAEKIDELLTNGKYKTTDIKKALLKFPRNEIMIDCKEYYAIDFYYYNKNFIPAWEAFGQ